jgi:hypothetical protein
MPSSEHVKRYIDDGIFKNVLKFWASNLKQGYLENEVESFVELKEFVRKAIEIHLKHLFNGNDKTRYFTDVLEKVKSDRLTNITKDIHVPSASNLNLADSVEI